MLFLAALSAAAIPLAFLLRLPRGAGNPFLQTEEPSEPKAA